MNFRDIEARWQREWRERGTYRVEVDKSRPKFYVLDMFPYPSGAGLHVGHPLGYIASDIFARYKRLCGFNVLHPMGYDAFGLPAEQYAIQTGQHPAATTEQNIARYREQLSMMGFSFDPAREINTSEPAYYRWTQWAFLKMYGSYFDADKNKARPIEELVARFAESNEHGWNDLSEAEREDVLMGYRLAFRADTMVNWCQALGTVLANDEVVGGLSERGGHPVEQRKMTQWQLRVTAYAQRLLDGLDTLEWSDSLKDIQRNWIGRSEGAQVFFAVEGGGRLEVFTTRPDTIFGVTFMVVAPEHEMVAALTTAEQKREVEEYVAQTKKRSERERMTEVKRVTGAFTGSYALNPFTDERIPIWVGDYVLAGYGTGAIMAVPAHDDRDRAFADHFGLPVVHVVEGKDERAVRAALDAIEARGLGTRRVNYRLRDAIFSRQRYWGEPFPVWYEDGVTRTLGEGELPLELPMIADFRPTEQGEPPLARAEGWRYETSTMPGFAGSSAYYLRYMDPRNAEALVSHEANDYWRSVDLYVGGIEHATGHLVYSRFWNKFLYDLGYVVEDEPFRKLVNQGMIQGRSNFVYRVVGTNTFVSHGLSSNYDVQPLHVDVSIVRNDVLDLNAFRAWRPEFADAEFVLEDGKYICGWAVEKMSKSMFNVVNPDNIVRDYGADTLRMYEMFLGPLEQSKPWDTNGIDGVHKFLKKFWRLFEAGVTEEKATPEELKILNKTIKKVREDIESFSFNTAVAAFMICLNELGECHKREILDPLTRLLYPFAPHIAEEVWHEFLGHTELLFDAAMPSYDPSKMVESAFDYPVSVNGKLRFKKLLPLGITVAEIEKAVLADPAAAKWLEGKTPRKVIIVVGKIVNIVV